MSRRAGLLLVLVLAALSSPVGARGEATPAPGGAGPSAADGMAAAPAEPAAPAIADSLLESAPDFEALRPHLLTLTTARVAAAAWNLVPRLVTLGRPDLMVDFLAFWEDRCGRSEPLVRARILGAIWDGAFDEGLYDAWIVDELMAWIRRDPRLLGQGRLDYDVFTAEFADQLLPHQADASLPEYFCLLYSNRFEEAADLLRDEALADTWLRWYDEHPEGADGGEIVPAGDEEQRWGELRQGRGGGRFPSSVLLTTGTWQPRGDVRLAGSHVLLGVVVEQRLGGWFVRLPFEARLGRTDRPYLVDQDRVRAYSDRFDAIHLGLEGGRPLVRRGRLRLDAFGGLGYDGIRPFLEEEVVLATVNLSLGFGLRWEPVSRPWLLGLDARREWLGTRNEGPDSLGGGATSLRLGLGLRFGRWTETGGSS